MIPSQGHQRNVEYTQNSHHTVFGSLRMAREIETMQMIYMIPLVQARNESWEFCFRCSNYWFCQEPEGWYDPVYDRKELAQLPRTQGEPQPCPQ